MTIEETLSGLAEADRALRSLDTGDLERMEAHLARRASLVEEAAGEIARLRQNGQPVPTGAREALEKSQNAGMHSLRQLIFAQHLLATELGRLKQEQCLLDALEGGIEASRPRLEITA